MITKPTKGTLRRLITLAELKTHLHYNPETGVFTWVVPTANRIKPGDVAGHDSGPRGDRQAVIGVCGRYYKQGRLAWFYMTGTWPVGQIDHKDGNHANQRFDNLRDVTQRTNTENQTRPHRDKQPGTSLGVYWRKDTSKWMAVLTVNYQRIYLGQFEDAESAKEAYLKAKREHHKGCTI